MSRFRGRIARINLTSGEVKYEGISEEVLRKFIGGKGLGYYLIYREIPPGTKALSQSNKILFVPGALSGLLPGGSKVAVISISPETGLINDSYAGDRFGPILRRAGFNALMIEGMSEKPVYILVKKRNIDIKDASHLWGKGVYECTEELWKTHGNVPVACIGPGGENLVRFANIMFDKERSAGRGGLGAVMGSKRLKAVIIENAVNGVSVYNEEEWDRLKEEYYNRYKEEKGLMDLKEYGTTNGLISSSFTGMSPSYNFKKPYVEKNLAERLSGKEIKKYEIEPEKYIHGKSCPVKCARYVKVRYKNFDFFVKPEYESIAMLGAATGVFDFEKVAYFNHLANDLGLDSIASGNVIGWLFEMVERKEIDGGEIGFPISGFGDADAEERLLKLISKREGIGAILAEGVKRAGEILNRGEKYAVHVKGMEAPAWDPRGRRTYALSYATADVGASHLRGWPYPHSLPRDGPARELVPSLIESRDKDALFDSLGVCKFLPYKLKDLRKFFQTVMGEDVDLENLGWRVESISRIYNVLGSLNPIEDDTIPPRWWEEEKDGPARGNASFMDHRDFIDAKRDFYRLRGWHEDYGVPLAETLKDLGLGDFVEDGNRALNIVKGR